MGNKAAREATDEEVAAFMNALAVSSSATPKYQWMK